jgi:hypothetical protein
MHFKKGRKPKHHHHMPTLQSILAEVTALANIEESAFEAAVAQCVTDLNTLIAAAPATPVADPVATVVVTTTSGVVTTCVPQS